MGIIKVVIAPAIHVGGDGSTVVIDNLTSDSTTAALSANQGMVLKGLIDNIEVGGSGNDGWSPVLASIADGARIVSQVVDWVGGEGAKPATGKYIGSEGLVDTAAEATDIRGIQGIQGAPGDPGNDGSPGADGSDGSDGRNPEYQFSATHLQYRLEGDTEWIDLLPISSLKGADGVDGTDGTDGSDGSPGADGKSVELQKTATHIQWRLVGASTWNDLVALTDIAGADGEPGSAGADGNTIISGSGAPGEGTGADGDYYIDAAAQLIYGPKASGAWPSGVSYKGEKGDPGDAGADGADGNDGAAGRSVQFFTEVPSGDFGTDYFAGDIVKL